MKIGKYQLWIKIRLPCEEMYYIYRYELVPGIPIDLRSFMCFGSFVGTVFRDYYKSNAGNCS